MMRLAVKGTGMPRQLKNLRIDEVSSVDHGAGEGVHVLLMKRRSDAALYTSIEKGELSDDVVAYLKREFSADERRSAASSGAALPDGSFPIKTVSDLHNAIQAIGRAKDRAKAMAHIKSRARALGATDALPDSWSKRDDKAAKALALTIETILSDKNSDDVSKSASIVETFKQFHSYLDGDKEPDMAVTPEVQKAITDTIAKALTDAGIKPIAKMTEAHQNYHSQLDGDEASKFAAMSHEERNKYIEKHPIGADGKDGEEDGEDGETEEQAEAKKKLTKSFTDIGIAQDVAKLMAANIIKAGKKKKNKDGQNIHEEGDEESDDGNKDEPEVRAKKALAVELKKRDDEIAKLTKQLGVLSEKDQRVEFGKRAIELGLPEADGELLLKVHRGDPAAIKKLEEKIAGLVKQVESGDVFKEYGSRQNGSGGATPYDQLVAKASELRKNHPELKLTAEQAFDKVMTDPENAELVQLEKRDRQKQIAKIA